MCGNVYGALSMLLCVPCFAGAAGEVRGAALLSELGHHPVSNNSKEKGAGHNRTNSHL